MTSKRVVEATRYPTKRSNNIRDNDDYYDIDSSSYDNNTDLFVAMELYSTDGHRRTAPAASKKD